MRARHGTLVAVVAAALGRSAFAQDVSAQLVGDRETAAQLSQIVESARSRGLPIEPIVAKARLGAMRHSPPARILSGLQAVAKRLELSREALGARSIDTDIAAGEDALSISGVTPEMLRTIRAAEPSRSVAVPIGVMAQLVASGVKPSDATQIVSRLVRAGASSKDLVSLGNDVNQDVVAGAGAVASLTTRLERLKPLLARLPTPTPAAGITSATTDPRGRP